MLPTCWFMSEINVENQQMFNIENQQQSKCVDIKKLSNMGNLTCFLKSFI